MSLNINVNTNATRVAHSLNSHYNNLIKSVNRLSSGIKLNSSADDPLQYANHNIYQGKIAVFKTGLVNLNEAVSMAQTAESAIDKIGDNLIRMKEIAEQATNGTYTQEQRLILHSEFTIAAMEIDRIASFTKFKDSYLLNGSISSRNNSDRMGSWYQTINRELNVDKDNMQGLKIQFGDSSKETEDFYFFQMSDLRMDGLLREYMPGEEVINKISVSTQHAAQKTLEVLDIAIAEKNKAKTYAGIFQNRLESSLNHLEDHVDRISELDSKITDTDLAEEMTNYTTYRMLSETATSMLGQANILPQIALKLLQK